MSKTRQLSEYREAQPALQHVRVMQRVLGRIEELPREAIGDFTLLQMTYMDVLRQELADEALAFAFAILELEEAYPEIGAPEEKQD